MPSVKVKTASGSVNFAYTISTPKSSSAKSIDKSLPTLLFLHGLGIASDIWQQQFGDPKLRRFNLVAVDLRSNGGTGSALPLDYRQREAAIDVHNFMQALKLPPCFLVALSTGTIVALELATTFPQAVLGLFLISPLEEPETPEIAQGRKEMQDVWTEAHKEDGTIATEVLADCLLGLVQLAFNGQTSSLISALIVRAISFAIKNWSGKMLETCHVHNYYFIIERVPQTEAALAKLTGPVVIVHGGDDVAYPPEDSQKLLKRLHNVGVRATILEVPHAPHFPNLTHSQVINPQLHDFILAETKTDVPAAPLHAVSPFEADLIKAGWEKHDSDSD